MAADISVLSGSSFSFHVKSHLVHRACYKSPQDDSSLVFLIAICFRMLTVGFLSRRRPLTLKSLVSAHLFAHIISSAQCVALLLFGILTLLSGARGHSSLSQLFFYLPKYMVMLLCFGAEAAARPSTLILGPLFIFQLNVFPIEMILSRKDPPFLCLC